MVHGSSDLSALERLTRHATRWRVRIDEVRTTETSLLGFGTRGKTAVVLKLIRKPSSEEWRCGEILGAFHGRGMIQPLEYADGAVLLPRLRPGGDLSELSRDGRDAEATDVIAASLQRICGATPPADLRTVGELQPDFVRFRDQAADLVSMDTIEKAEALFAELCATQRNPQLLHGDLHHYNVLFDAESGWVVIDPWGVVGELEFEVGASLRNPTDAPHLLQDPNILQRRLRTYASHLSIDADRALMWAFATTVLGILWPVDGSLGQDLRRPFADSAQAMLRLLE